MMEVNFFTSSVNMLLDICIFVLPFPALRKLRMATKKKGELMVLFRRDCCVYIFQ
jgi:hypothetical protein